MLIKAKKISLKPGEEWNLNNYSSPGIYLEPERDLVIVVAQTAGTSFVSVVYTRSDLSLEIVPESEKKKESPLEDILKVIAITREPSLIKDIT